MSYINLSENTEIALAADGETKKATMLGYSGKPIEHPLVGKLVVDVGGIDFTFSKYPILEEHKKDKKIGFAPKPDVSQNKVEFDSISLLENETAKEFYNNASNGFPYQASIGFYPKKTEEIEQGAEADVNGYKLKGPALIFRESTFKECSVCTFGADHRTKSEVKQVEMSDDLLEELTPTEEFTVRTPNFEGTEDSDWSSISKTFNAYLDSYSGDDKKDWKNWSETSKNFKNWAARTSIAGDPNASTFSKGVYYPVVNHNTGKLNKNAVEATKTYADKNNQEEIKKKAENLYDKHFKEKEQAEMSDENVTELKEKLENYETKLTEQNKMLEQMQMENAKKDIEHKLSEEDAQFVMKFYNDLSTEKLTELANKLAKYELMVDELGAPKGSDDTSSSVTKEPTVDEVKEYAKKNYMSFMEANKKLTEERSK